MKDGYRRDEASFIKKKLTTMSFSVRRNALNQTAHATSRNALRPNYGVKFSRQAEKMIVLCIF